MAKNLKIMLAQINPCVGDIEENAEKIIQACLESQQHRADIVLFPELALTGYPPEDLLLRAGLHRRVQVALKKIALICDSAWAVVGHPSQQKEKTFNSASFLHGGEVLATYHKHFLPNYSVFDEKRYFKAGTYPCAMEINGVTVALTICEDIWDKTPIAEAAKAGADVILNLNASPYHAGKGAERVRVLAQRAIESSLPIIYVNQVGGQDELVFDGQSLVVDRRGELVHRSPAFVESLYPVTLVVDEESEVIGGVLGEDLEPEQSIYRALVTGVRDYVEKNRFPGAVIGLSGGIDSALTLAIAVDALGADRVSAVMMPSPYTAKISLEDAREQASTLGIKYQEISIESSFQSFLETLEPVFDGYAADTTEENIQARCRGVILMALSNKFGQIVLTTGNKSEMAVGYATLYGDMAGGFAPLKDVPKTCVYALAKYRNSIARVIPERVITRAPSAELAPDQKDSDSLPDYEVLDPILELYVEEDLCIEDIAAKGYDESLVRRVAQMVDRNEYKRRQAPPGVKITQRAFGRDRRYPITSGFGRNRK